MVWNTHIALVFTHNPYPFQSRDTKYHQYEIKSTKIYMIISISTETKADKDIYDQIANGTWACNCSGRQYYMPLL
jgi:hypothetical protein